MKNKIRAREMIRDLGGPTEVYNWLRRRGFELTLKTVNGWVSRESVPSHWVAELTVKAEESGWTLRLRDYKKPTAEWLD